MGGGGDGGGGAPRAELEARLAEVKTLALKDATAGRREFFVTPPAALVRDAPLERSCRIGGGQLWGGDIRMGRVERYHFESPRLSPPPPAGVSLHFQSSMRAGVPQSQTGEAARTGHHQNPTRPHVSPGCVRRNAGVLSVCRTPPAPYTDIKRRRRQAAAQRVESLSLTPARVCVPRDKLDASCGRRSGQRAREHPAGVSGLAWRITGCCPRGESPTYYTGAAEMKPNSAEGCAGCWWTIATRRCCTC